MAKLPSLMLLFATVAVAAQEVPAEIRGKWLVEQVLPTSAISCWGTKDASRIIGTEIRYTAHSLAWEGYFVAGPSVSQRAVTAEQFQRENSGQGTTSSQVSFRTLGIRSAKVKQIQLGHPPADITGATTEIPGDKVLLKNKNKIVFSVCNVFFQAKREQVSSGSTQ